MRLIFTRWPGFLRYPPSNGCHKGRSGEFSVSHMVKSPNVPFGINQPLANVLAR
jgi:hypothetical protein